MMYMTQNLEQTAQKREKYKDIFLIKITSAKDFSTILLPKKEIHNTKHFKEP